MISIGRNILLCGVISISLGACQTTSSSKFQSTFGHDCTVEGAKYRAQRGHRYKGQCADSPIEADIIAIHERELAIGAAKRKISRAQYAGAAQTLEELKAERARLEKYRDLRPLLSEEKREQYDRRVKLLDKAIAKTEKQYIPDERRRVASLEKQIKARKSDLTQAEKDANKAKARENMIRFLGKKPDKKIPKVFIKLSGFTEEEMAEIREEARARLN